MSDILNFWYQLETEFMNFMTHGWYIVADIINSFLRMTDILNSYHLHRTLYKLQTTDIEYDSRYSEQFLCRDMYCKLLTLKYRYNYPENRYQYFQVLDIASRHIHC